MPLCRKCVLYAAQNDITPAVCRPDLYACCPVMHEKIAALEAREKRVREWAENILSNVWDDQIRWNAREVLTILNGDAE